MKRFNFIFFVGILELFLIAAVIISNQNEVTGHAVNNLVPVLHTGECGSAADINIMELAEKREICLEGNNIRFMLENKADEIEGIRITFAADNVFSSNLFRRIKGGSITDQKIAIGTIPLENLKRITLTPIINAQSVNSVKSANSANSDIALTICTDRAVTIENIVECN